MQLKRLEQPMGIGQIIRKKRILRNICPYCEGSGTIVFPWKTVVFHHTEYTNLPLSNSLFNHSLSVGLGTGNISQQSDELKIPVSDIEGEFMEDNDSMHPQWVWKEAGAVSAAQRRSNLPAFVPLQKAGCSIPAPWPLRRSPW